jgi:DNA invertase Pin-like site-specific DNA recombinase
VVVYNIDRLSRSLMNFARLEAECLVVILPVQRISEAGAQRSFN